MVDTGQITERILGMIREILDDQKAAGLTSETSLVGDSAILKSRELVELLLLVEEYAEDDLGVTFDWASDAAMSERRSVFRTPQALAAHLESLQNGGTQSG